MHWPERGQIYLYASSPDAEACRVYLSRKYGRFMLLIDNNLLLPGAKLHILNNIYRKWSKATCSAYYQAKSLPLQHEFGRVALPSVRSNGPTDPLHISCIFSIWKILHFYSSISLNPSKSAFFHALTLSLPTCCLLFLNSAHAQDGFT
jgi:uncharacterized membrane protein (GlpM family)